MDRSLGKRVALATALGATVALLCACAPLKRIEGAPSSPPAPSAETAVVRKGTSEGAPTSVSGVPQGGWTENTVREWLRNRYGTEWYVYQEGPRKRFSTIRGRVLQYRGPTGSEEVHRISDLFLCEIEALLTIRIGDLKYLEMTENTDRFSISYSQSYDTIPVDRGMVFVDIWKSAGGTPPEINVTNNTYPNITISAEPKITAEAALLQAARLNESLLHEQGFGDERRRTPEGSPRLVIFPKPIENDTRVVEYSYHLVWIAVFDRFTFYIDAHSGEVLRRVNNWKR